MSLKLWNSLNAGKPLAAEMWGSFFICFCTQQWQSKALTHNYAGWEMWAHSARLTATHLQGDSFPLQSNSALFHETEFFCNGFSRKVQRMVPVVYHPAYSLPELPIGHRFPIKIFGEIYDMLLRDGIVQSCNVWLLIGFCLCLSTFTQ